MSRLETSPTSTRPASTANFILIPLMGTPGLSAMGPDLPSFSSPGCAAPAPAPVSWLAIAKAGRTGTGGVHRWGTCSTTVSERLVSEEEGGKERGKEERDGALSPPQRSCWRSTDAHAERIPPHSNHFEAGEPPKWAARRNFVSRWHRDTGNVTAPLHGELVPLSLRNLIAGEWIKKKKQQREPSVLAANEGEIVRQRSPSACSWSVLRVGPTATGGYGDFSISAQHWKLLLLSPDTWQVARSAQAKKLTDRRGTVPPVASKERGPLSRSRQTQRTCLNVNRDPATLHSLPDIPR